MISLTCTSCKKLLEMDDAFAGGVCRCKFCGTIQTVPSKVRDRNGARTKVASKTIYAKTARGEAIPSSGLDQLAQVVASSGLTSDRLRIHAPRPSVKPSNQRLMLLIAAALLLVFGIFIGAWFAVRGESSSRQSPRPAVGQKDPDAQPSPAPPMRAAPTFCEVSIPEHVVAYVLDRGSGTKELFSHLKEAAYKSVESLGSDRKYQIIFWNNGSDDFFPASPTYAMPQSIEAARRTLDSVYANGQTDVESALKLAVKSNPDVIVLATGKGWQLDQTFIDQVLGILKDRHIKVHTFTLGGEVQSEALKTIAQKTNGTSRLVTEGELKKYARGE